MKNTQTAAMYIGVGAILTLILLFLMGRIRTERYEEATEQELLDFLGEVEATPSVSDDESMGPSPMADSDDEDEE
jgi:hypothetical protein